MIKFKRLPENILESVPILSEKLREEKNLVALYLFGSAIKGYTDPLSDLDLAVLLDNNVPREEFLNEYLRVYGIIVDILKVDEVDLTILNEAPLRIAHNVLYKSKLLFCNNNRQLAEFIENNYKRYPDFMHFKREYNILFQKKLGIVR
jgi:predicted nucleotidyltransferase